MTVNDYPLIAQFASGLDQCIIDQLLAINDYQPSQGWSHTTETASRVRQRTSLTYFDSYDDLRAVRELMLNRISEELGRNHPLENAEYLQLTRYGKNQQYEPHYDNFNLAGWENTVSIDRCATALLYLNDGFTGGATAFPLLDITILPKQGDILYFEYPPGADQYMLHAGQPVVQGEKRIASLWIRSGPWQLQG